jgi:hypothetical protein
MEPKPKDTVCEYQGMKAKVLSCDRDDEGKITYWLQVENLPGDTNEKDEKRELEPIVVTDGDDPLLKFPD